MKQHLRPIVNLQDSALSTAKDWLWIVLIILIALLYRLDYLVASNFSLDSDEAIIGLMAKHILERDVIPIFYYGQHYMGSFEALCVAASFNLFGISSASLKIVPILFSLFFVVIVYLLAFECFERSKISARVAAILCAVPPLALLEWSTKARGGFIEILCIGALSLLLLARSISSGRIKVPAVLASSALLGFGWWTNNQIIFFIPAWGFFLLLAIKRDYPKSRFLAESALYLFFAGSAFLIGSAPFWIYNLEHNFISFQLFTSAAREDYLKHFFGLIEHSLPILLGAQRFWSNIEIFAGITFWVASVYVVLSLVVVWILVKRFYYEQLLVSPLAYMLVLFFLSTAAIFCLSSFGYLYQAPRYLLPLYVAIFPLAAMAIAWIKNIVGVSAYAIVGALLLVNLNSYLYTGRAIAGEPIVFAGQRVSRDHSDLLSWLNSNKVRVIRTNYWIGYRIAFETGERVVFTIFDEPKNVRITDYEKTASTLQGSEIPFILVPEQAKLVEIGLQAAGYSYQRTELSGYVVLYKLNSNFKALEPVSRELFTLKSSLSPDELEAMIDHDLDSRWASHAPQSSDMQIELSFSSPVALRGIDYLLGAWPQDYPRALKITAITRSNERIELLSPEQSKALMYLNDKNDDIKFRFEPVNTASLILSLERGDTIYDWSIAELKLFQ